MDQPLELDNPFWRFSLAVYAMPGVQKECLSLQNEAGVNVNMLLYCAWRGAEGDCPTDVELKRLTAVTRAWQANIITPLRETRNHLKRTGVIDSANAQIKILRSKILEVEFLGEQMEQAILYRETASDFRCSKDRLAAIDANLALYLNTHNRTLDAVPMLKSNAALLSQQ